MSKKNILLSLVISFFSFVFTVDAAVAAVASAVASASASAANGGGGVFCCRRRRFLKRVVLMLFFSQHTFFLVIFLLRCKRILIYIHRIWSDIALDWLSACPRLLVVHYEKFVQDPVAELRKVHEFLNFPVDEARMK